MDTEAVAVLIAALSLAMAGVSLGWQIAQWLLSAGRAKATLMYGLMQGSNGYVGPIRKNGAAFSLDSLRRQGIEGPDVVGIQVTNHGRAPVVIEKIAMRSRGGDMSFVPVDQRIGPDLPYRLEPGSNASWFMTADHASTLVQTSREVLHEDVRGIYMTAELATGKTVKTPQTLRI